MNMYDGNRHFTDLNLNRSRFAEREELLKQYQEIEFNATKYEGLNAGGGVAVEVTLDDEGHVTGAVVDSGDSNTIIVSSTGAGKTRKVLAEYIISCIHSLQSMIIHDPKGENYCFYYDLLKKMGYKIRVLNLRDPMKGDRFNLLEKAANYWKKGKTSRALEIARAVAESLYIPLEDKDDKFWTEASVNLFLCYFIIAAESYDPEYVSISTIYGIHVEGLEPGKIHSMTKLREYLEKHKGEKVYELGIPSACAPNDTRQSIYSIFTNGLARITLNEDISDMLVKSTFEAEELASEKQPMALFIITRDESPAGYSTVVSSIVDGIYTSLIDMAQKCDNNRLPREVHFILEEFGNISKLNNINDMLTASRSRGIRMVIVLQSLRQLYLNYDVNYAHVLIGNSKNFVFMSTTDVELLELVSKRCGTVINPYTNQPEAFIGVDRLMHLDSYNGEALVLMGQNYPYITYFPDISHYDFIVPLKTLNLRPRKRLEFKKRVFTKPVEKPKKRDYIEDDILEIVEEDDKPRETKPKRSNGAATIPTFEEFMEIRRKQREEREEREKKVFVPDAKTIDELIAKVDKKIAEIEEKERLEKKTLKNVAIKSIEFPDLAVTIVADVLDVSEALATVMLKGAESGRKVLRGIPADKAKKLVEELALVGTVAEVA